MLTDDLASTFDEIAKIASVASASLSDPNSTLNEFHKIQRAHSALTLIIADAMRGLDSAMMSAIARAVATISEFDGIENGTASK